jgi:hypothetical protein
MPVAFEDSLSFSNRRQDSESIVSELLSPIEHARKHRQVSDLAGQIEGVAGTLLASSKNFRERRLERLQSASPRGAIFSA